MSNTEMNEGKNIWVDLSASLSFCFSLITYESIKHAAGEVVFWIQVLAVFFSAVWFFHRMILWYKRKGFFSILGSLYNSIFFKKNNNGK